MSGLDFNDAPEQRMQGEPIPGGSVVLLSLKIDPGGWATNMPDGSQLAEGMLTGSQSSDSVYLKCECEVLAGTFQGRKIYENIGWDGGKRDDKGRSKFGLSGRATIRAIIESARQIRTEDGSPQAANARRINGLADLNGMTFVAKLGIEPAQDGYAAKNKLRKVLTPSDQEYAAVINGGEIIGTEAMPAPKGGAQAKPQQAKPAWAAPGQNAAPAAQTGANPPPPPPQGNQGFYAPPQQQPPQQPQGNPQTQQGAPAQQPGAKPSWAS